MALSPNNISDLTEAELRELVRAAEKALDKRLAERARLALTEARRLAAEVGYQATFTKLGKSGGSKAAAKAPASPRGPAARKYRNPDNPAETWAGRGRPPKWVQAALDRGQSLEDLAIAPREAVT